MSEEDREMLVSAVREFCQKEVEGSSLRIERSGIERSLVEKLGSQGFMGLKVPETLGGSGVDEITYALMLKEFARFSPSVAMLIAIENSVVFPLMSETEFGKGIIPEVIAGKKLVGVALPFRYVEGGNTVVAKSKLTGTKKYVFMPESDCLMINVDQSPDSVVSVTDHFHLEQKLPSLGFRGLGIGNVTFDSAGINEIVKENGKNRMFEIVDGLGLEISAIALGIAEESHAKAVEYSKVRGTFGHLLKDFQPVAFPLSRADGEIKEAASQLNAQLSEPSKRWLKQQTMDLAVNISKLSIQVHGGYGYLDDFGVEKFYRDSMMLSSVFSESPVDDIALSKDLYQQDAGFM